MDAERAIAILERHNEWRKGEDDRPMQSPSDVSEATSLAIAALKAQGEAEPCAWRIDCGGGLIKLCVTKGDADSFISQHLSNDEYTLRTLYDGPQPAQPILTDAERGVIRTLCQFTSEAFTALDDSEDIEGLMHGVDVAQVLPLIEKLQGLPDDKPGLTLAPGGKAEWALRRLLDRAAQPKRLEWVDHTETSLTALSPFGYYLALLLKTEAGGGPKYGYVYMGDEGEIQKPHFTTMEAAKDAAQADFDKRAGECFG